MQKLVLLFLLVVASFYFNSCTICSCKKVPCPAFDDPYFGQWMKSFSDKRILYKNSNLISDTFTLSRIDSLVDKEANKGCSSSNNGCLASIRFASYELTSSGPQKFLLDYNLVTDWSGVSSKQISIRVKNFSVKASNVSDTGFVFQTMGIQTTYTPIITLRSTIYSNVQMIQVDTNAKLPGIYKIYLSKNTGLVAYEEYPTHELWIRE